MGSRVLDTTYYDLLNASPIASDLELKKAYRRAALINHPDKNPGDKEAQYRFQEIAKAYQVLSDPSLRKRYDQLGLTATETQGQFEDPSELFTRIFGGDGFRDWIGELSYLRDAVKMMEIKSQVPDAGTGQDEYTSDSRDVIQYQGEQRPTSQGNQSSANTSPRSERHRNPESTPSRRSSNTQRSTPNHQQKKQLEEYERRKRENHGVRIETIKSIILTKIDGVVKYHDDHRELYRLERKIQNEAESMKLESFGDQLLHTIGESFVNRSKAFIDAVPIITPLRTLLGDWRREFQDVYNIVATGLEANKAITAMKKIESDPQRDEGFDQGEGEEMTEEKKLVIGKVLAACWKTIVKEVHDITREVCNAILYDEDASYSCRRERAKALIVIGEIFIKTARQPGEEVMEQIFEILVSDATRKTRK